MLIGIDIDVDPMRRITVIGVGVTREEEDHARKRLLQTSVILVLQRYKPFMAISLQNVQITKITNSMAVNTHTTLSIVALVIQNISKKLIHIVSLFPTTK